ncbi:phage tail length tape measure family protein [Pseudomonas aeruginosa]|nr:phage tail length tape measure family protein [Pseudomonas aeruginosa]
MPAPALWAAGSDGRIACQVNGTRYEAVAAPSEITSTGKFTVEQIEQVGTTAIAMQEATGRAVSETVAEFSSWPMIRSGVAAAQ